MDGQSTSQFELLDVAVSNIYADLCEQKSISCLKTGVRFDPLPKPTVVVTDVSKRTVRQACFIDLVQIFQTFTSILLRVIERTNRKDVKLFAWYPIGVSSSFRALGPPSLGGRGNPRSTLDAEATATGRTFDELAWEVNPLCLVAQCRPLTASSSTGKFNQTVMELFPVCLLCMTTSTVRKQYALFPGES